MAGWHDFPFSWEWKIIPTDFHSMIFQRGRLNHQPVMDDHMGSCPPGFRENHPQYHSTWRIRGFLQRFFFFESTAFFFWGKQKTDDRFLRSILWLDGTMGWKICLPSRVGFQRYGIYGFVWKWASQYLSNLSHVYQHFPYGKKFRHVMTVMLCLFPISRHTKMYESLCQMGLTIMSKKTVKLVELRRRLSGTWRITPFPKRTYWPGLLSTGMKLQS